MSKKTTTTERSSVAAGVDARTGARGPALVVVPGTAASSPAGARQATADQSTRSSGASMPWSRRNRSTARREASDA
jgi:hypothetical protein